MIVDEANANSALAYGALVAPNLVPDLTTPDPAEGARGLYELEAAIVQTAPVDEWVEVLVYPNSPATLGYLRNFQSLSGSQLVALVGGDGYVVREVRAAVESEIDRVPIDVKAGMPSGSAVVSVTSSSGPIEYVNPDGEILHSIDGWTDRSRLVVVSPTESGWKIFWTEEV